MRHITSELVQTLFSPKEIIDIVHQGIINYGEGEYSIPDRMHINRGVSTNLIMPAFGPNYFCTKLISVDPQNNVKNLPIISGILVLNDSSTGATLSTLDASIITALRTAAVGAIGINLIWAKNDIKLGVIGLGVQGLWQTIFAASTKRINEVYCYSRNKSKFLSYKSKVSKRFPDINIVYCTSSKEVVEKAQVILACTTSKNPVFATEDLNISEKRFISVGSFSKIMQELPEQVYKQADAMIIDSEAAKNEVGDVIQTINNNWIPYSNIYSLAEVLLKNTPIKEHKNIVFKSVGMAAFDLALAIAVYERIIKIKT